MSRVVRHRYTWRLAVLLCAVAVGLVNADDTLLFLGIEYEERGTPTVIATYVNSDDPTTCFEGFSSLWAGNYVYETRTLIRVDGFCDSINAHAGKIIKEYQIMLFWDDRYGPDSTVDAYYLLKPWDNTVVSHTYWDTDQDWTNGGADETGTDFNIGDGEGADRGSASQAQEKCELDSWNIWSVDTAYVNEWLRADSANPDTLFNCGHILIGNASTFERWYSDNYDTDSTLAAQVRVILTDAPAGPSGPPDYRHGPGGVGVRHSPDGASVRHKP